MKLHKKWDKTKPCFFGTFVNFSEILVESKVPKNGVCCGTVRFRHVLRTVFFSFLGLTFVAGFCASCDAKNPGI